MQTQEALDRCEYAIRHQQDEIARLRADLGRRDEELKQLLAWVNGDSDALTTLQRTYMDPNTSTPDRERPKLSVQLRVGPSVLSERLARARSIKAAGPRLLSTILQLNSVSSAQHAGSPRRSWRGDYRSRHCPHSPKAVQHHSDLD